MGHKSRYKISKRRIYGKEPIWKPVNKDIKISRYKINSRLPGAQEEMDELEDILIISEFRETKWYERLNIRMREIQAKR